MYYFEMEERPGLMKGALNLNTINNEEAKMLLKTNCVIAHVLQPKIIDNKVVRDFLPIRLIVGKNLGNYAEVGISDEKYLTKYRDNEQVLVCSANDELIRNLVKVHNMASDERINFNEFYSDLLQESSFRR